MQSSAFSLTHTIPTPNPRKLSSSLHRYINPLTKSLTYTRSLSTSSSPRLQCSSSSAWIIPPKSQSNSVQVKAADSISESANDDEALQSKFKDALVLALLFGLWILFNIYFNIYNKQVLKVFPYPGTVTAAQFAAGTVFVILMWTSNLYKCPKITGAQLIAILPLAVVHTLGNLFTNMSLGKVSVSFTHTIKAMEPFFSVVLSSMFLGEVPNIWIISSLIPIVGGVGLASMTEASFNWAGFWSAMASNLTNQSRNVLSKKLMVKKEPLFPFSWKELNSPLHTCSQL